MKIVIYEDFREDLLNEWYELYLLGANYNLSHKWCMSWSKFFLNKNSLHIITVVEKNKIVSIAPMYKEGNTLLLLGSNPDLYDVFDILYNDEKYLVMILDYIFDSKFDIDFRYVNSSSVFGKLLIKYLYQKRIKYISHVIDTNPIVKLDSFVLKRKLKDDIKRLKNRIVNNYGMEAEFEYNCEKSHQEITNFINIHKERWGGGPFNTIENFDNFIHSISQEDLVNLSKLKIGEDAVAYHYGYIDSRGHLNSAIPAYNNKFDDVSPGKILLSDIIGFLCQESVKLFNFGRGAEGYKYWFANDSTLLYNIKTHTNRDFKGIIKKLPYKVWIKIKRILKRFIK